MTQINHAGFELRFHQGSNGQSGSNASPARSLKLGRIPEGSSGLEIQFPPGALAHEADMTRLSFVLAVALAALGGCASYEWQRPGADERTVALDMEQCRGLAHLRSGQNRNASNASAATAPAPGKDDLLIASHPATESPMEMDQENSCMQQRGYRLTRVQR